LANFDIIIYCVGAFKHEFERGAFHQLTLKEVPLDAIRRENEIGVALEKGKTVCFLGLNSEDYVVTGIFKSSNVYWGAIQDDGKIFRNLQVKRSEFKSFISDVGATQIAFEKDSVDVVICVANEAVVGFSKKVEKGLLLFIPCIWASKDPKYFTEHFKKIVSGLIAFSAKLILEPPNFIKEFSFAKESITQNTMERIKKEQIEPLQRSLDFYHKIKSVLWLGNNALVKATENFLNNMGFQTQIDEIYEEDLWIMQGSKRGVIIEVKGLNNNLTRSDINKLDDHREARGVEDMTGLLFANTFMSADSLDTKDQPFPPNIIAKAVSSNLVITRTIDLCRMFDCFEGQSAKEILGMMLGKSGWLIFQDGKIQLIRS